MPRIRWTGIPGARRPSKKPEQEDKPIFLSIGYATCHWCHVMAHESFEDEEVAGLLNQSFVSIKVDREERPDMDQIYMSVCQALTGQGGWPLSIFMTPEGNPFFAGTYFPKTGRMGMMGFTDLSAEDRHPLAGGSGKDPPEQRRDPPGPAEGRITGRLPEPSLDLGVLKKGYAQLRTDF